MIIYVVISAILLYLYYLKKDIKIFGAFVVVMIELYRLKRSGSGYEGFNIGNSGNDKECAKYGFSKPNIKDGASLVNELKKIKKAANKYIKDGDESVKTAAETIMAAISEDQDKLDKINKSTSNFYGASSRIYSRMESKNGSNEVKTVYNDMKASKTAATEIVKIIKDGEISLKFLINIGKKEEIKNGNKATKQLFGFYKCLCSHWISIWKSIQENIGSKSDGGDDEGGDEKGEDKKEGDDE